MEVVVLDPPVRDVIGWGSYYGGPDCEFVVASDGQVYFQVVGDTVRVWAGPDPESFCRIAAVWNRYQDEMQRSKVEPTIDSRALRNVQ